MMVTMALISSPPFLLPSAGTQGLGEMPSRNQLLEAHDNELARIGQTEQPPQQIPQTGSGQCGSGEKFTDEPDPSTSLTLGKGLPSLPKKLLERIWAEEYIDLSELLPGRVLPRIRRPQEGHSSLLLQLQELERPRNVIPDFTTWAQCFAVYTAALTLKHPERLPSLMAYLSETAKNAKKFKWPSWVIYDQNYRQEMATRGETNWADIEPRMYTQIFMDQKRTTEQWCRECFAADHVADDCPYSSRQSRRPRPASSKVDDKNICRKYNDRDRQCTFKNCRFSHVCRTCRGRHPQFLCPASQPPKDSTPSK